MDKNQYFVTAFYSAAKANRELLPFAEDFLGAADGKPAYAYVRVSNPSGGSNSSAEQQFDAIHKMAVKHEQKITWEGVYFDVAGRSDLLYRPGIQSLLAHIKGAGNGDRLILVDGIWRLSENLSDCMTLETLCQKANCDVLVCIRNGYMLSTILRILSDDTTYEQKIDLLNQAGFEDVL